MFPYEVLAELCLKGPVINIDVLYTTVVYSSLKTIDLSILQSKMSYGPQRLIYFVITTTKENSVLVSGNYYYILLVMLIGVSDL